MKPYAKSPIIPELLTKNLVYWPSTELTALDSSIVETECLRGLLIDLLIIEKLILTIKINYYNQIVIVKKKSSKDNMKSSRHVKGG